MLLFELFEEETPQKRHLSLVSQQDLPKKEKEKILPSQGLRPPGFSHMLVGKGRGPAGVGTAYMIGSPADCKRYQLKHNIQDSTKIIPFESKEQLGKFQLDEDLKKWFREKWVRFNPQGKIMGPCARGSDQEGKPKCLPQAQAQALGKKGRQYAAAKKRREDPNPERRGAARNVATKKKSSRPTKYSKRQLNQEWVNKYQILPKDESSNSAEPKLSEMAAAGNFGNRIWYHGTSKKAFNKILQTGLVKPFVADQSGPGEAIWLTSDLDEALTYGKIVLAIPNSVVRQYKVERWSGFPHGFLKQYKLKSSNYMMVIKEAVPLKYWKLVDPDSGELVNIDKGLESINERRDKMYQYIKSILPNWPDYVLKDWIYNLAKGDHQKGVDFRPSNDKNFLWGFNKETILKMLKNEGLSPNTKWTLIPNFEFKMENLHPDTQRRIKERDGGRKNPYQVSKDAERHATQSQLAQKQGGVRKEPVIGKMTPLGFELIEGWHRTIQHFVRYPNGYTGPAYVAKAQTKNTQTNPGLKEMDASLMSSPRGRGLRAGREAKRTGKEQICPYATGTPSHYKWMLGYKEGKKEGLKEVQLSELKKCPHCQGKLVSEEQLNDDKDACYYKVKSRYKVWPSAYASGALVQCRKKGAKNWGSKKS